MEVVHVEFVFDSVISPFVGGAVGIAGTDSAAGQPNGESLGVVIASVVVLREGSAAEFAAPPDECVLEKASRF